MGAAVHPIRSSTLELTAVYSEGNIFSFAGTFVSCVQKVFSEPFEKHTCEYKELNPEPTAHVTSPLGIPPENDHKTYILPNNQS